MTHPPSRAPLLWLALPFMAGLAAGRAAPPFPPLLALGPSLALAILSSRPTVRAGRFWGIGVAAAMFLAGSGSFELRCGRKREWNGWAPRQAWLLLRVDHAYASARPNRASGLATITAAEPRFPGIEGQRIYYALAKDPAEPEFVRSAPLAAEAVLSVVPVKPRPGGLDQRLSALGINFRLSRGRVRPAGVPNAYYRRLDALSRRLHVLLALGFERRPELGGVYRAMMLGEKRDLGKRQRRLFLHSGTMHLFAINGLHIDIVAVSVHALLAALRCPGLAGCALLLGVLWIDVSATGNSPSAMRAFGMVGSAQAGAALRRPRNALAALSGAALVAVLVSPMDFFGASFEMSYAVVLVLLTYGVPLAQALQEATLEATKGRRGEWTRRRRCLAAARRWLLGSVGIGVAAGLVGAVTGIEFFRIFVPGGFLANLVIAPLAMLVIISGAASLGVGLSGWPGASRLFNRAAELLLVAIQSLTGMAGRIPGAYFFARYRAAWIGPAALVCLLALCLAGYAWGWRRERGGFWPPAAAVILTLVFGVKFG